MVSTRTEGLLLDNNKVISDQLYNLIIVLSICWIRIKLWMISSYLYYCFILLWLLFIIPFMNMIVFVWDSWYVLSYSLSLNFVSNINKTHSDSLVGIIFVCYYFIYDSGTLSESRYSCVIIFHKCFYLCVQRYFCCTCFIVYRLIHYS